MSDTDGTSKSDAPLIGLDVGGTTLKGGVVDPANGDVLAFGSRPFAKEVPADEIWSRAADLVRELESESGATFRSVGVGCAGLFDRESGEVLASANMPNLAGHSLTAGMSKAMGGHDIVLENDANVAAFGEQWFGAGRHESNLVLVTLGTGVGGGVVLGNELFRGPGGNAGEIGHIAIYPRPGKSEFDGPPHAGLECDCGSYGCLERLVSATAAIRRAASRGLNGTLPELADKARLGPGPEQELMHQIGRDLGAGLATLVTLFDIDFFAIGGGFGEALDVLAGGANAVLEERRYGTRPARIAKATLGSNAGWIGAARLTAPATAPS